LPTSVVLACRLRPRSVCDVELVDGVADLGQQQLGRERGARLTEPPHGQLMGKHPGAVGEFGGDPAAAQLLLELLEGDQAPAVDQPVRVSEPLGATCSPPSRRRPEPGPPPPSGGGPGDPAGR
jgi:hypothetical protein